MHVPTYVPSSLDLVEARDVIFYPLRRLETGVIVSAAEGEVLVKGSLFSTVGDSPQQAANTHCKGPTAIVHCLSCFQTKLSDEVSTYAHEYAPMTTRLVMSVS